MKLSAALLAAVLSLAAAPALAQSDTPHFYIGGSIGQSKFSDACEGAGGGISCDDKDTAWKIFGGYQFHPNFAVEAGYTDLGAATVSGIPLPTPPFPPGSTASGAVEATAFELLGVGRVPLGRAWLYGKAGLYHGEATLKARGAGVSTSESDDGTEFTFGFGAGFDVTRNFALRAEWQRYSDFSGSDIDVLSIGLLFRLGR